MERYQEIERSIIKNYRKEIWRKFTKAVSDYKLVEDNDHIMVCISGGKDSFLLAKCIQELIRHGRVNFKATFVCMNPGYKKENMDIILKNAEILNIPLLVFETNIFEVANKLNEKSPCYMCARMRRGNLYNKAQELGCNKIALGHHFNDVVETSLLSMFYGSEIKTMLPKLHSENFKGLELIRPLYLVKEDSIISWTRHNKLKFINCACKFTEKTDIDISASKRKEIKLLLKELKKVNPSIDDNIFKSFDNVNINCILGYKKSGNYKSFLDNYEK